MVYLIVRHTVANYEAWRPFFDRDEEHRRSMGATGVNHVFRDLDDPNTISVVLEWDTAENAEKFASDPRLREVMQQGGVIGMPQVRAITSAA